MTEIKLNEQLFHAIKTRNSSLASKLIRGRADPNATIEPKLYASIDVGIPPHFHNVTPLHFAVMQKDKKIVEVLLKNGAVTDAEMLFTHGGKRTALYLAVEAQDLEMARLLLRYKAKVNVKVMDSYGDGCVTGNDGCTPLHCAIALGDLTMAKLLIEYGADVNAQVKGNVLGRKGTDAAYGYTPLHIAVEKGNLDAVKLLIDYGAKVDIKDHYGYAPLALADKKSAAIVRLIINHIVNHVGKLEASDQHVKLRLTSSKQPKIVDEKPIIPAKDIIENPEISDQHVNLQPTSNKQPKIVDKKPITPAVKDDKNTGEMDVVRKMDIDKEVEGKKPAKFASKVQLTKFVNKASLPIAGIASIILVYCIVAELSLALTISAAVIASVALIAKPIALYIQKDLLENSAVSKTLDTPSIKQPQAAAQAL
ncbi:ankyrin repeat domain-containing protein [Wolbachia endosymbiont of Folsomia candida]|uniref:ankyrin repeat domain-containing protein n=1 Tax=Wolbachia endosymbiont of Folsomia candida TaxID=169402 RepID=UPI000ADC4758|nr:ankyrin repeat domain-containing protein [Wolbachia endosymbiont of Folsomia candida]APR97747.1 hypothetical protein ASM33_00090 [Wolbachia endosymbiont of Folsomia candida]